MNCALMFLSTGDLVIQRHNEIRDCIGDIAAQVWTQVVKEPIVREAETQVGDSGLRLAYVVHGNLKQRHYLTLRLLIQMPHPTAIVHQNQFLNWELRRMQEEENVQPSSGSPAKSSWPRILGKLKVLDQESWASSWQDLVQDH